LNFERRCLVFGRQRRSDFPAAILIVWHASFVLATPLSAMGEERYAINPKQFKSSLIKGNHDDDTTSH
jgi:hypothetical protein